MKILITGADGFIGRNLTAELRNRNCPEILEYDAGTDPELLEVYCREAGFVFHLAGVNRPENQEEYMEGNFGFTSRLLESLKMSHNACGIAFSSSIQAASDNPYGKSKKACEDILFDYGRETGANVYIYRFPNLFGKWGRPNYNSVVATFCHSIANGLPIRVDDPEKIVSLAYIDDVVEELIRAMNGETGKPETFCEGPIAYPVRLREIAVMIRSFRSSRDTLRLPDLSSDLVRKLYSTYLSYLPPEQFSYPLTMHEDHRGSFTEFIKIPDGSQVSVNISKPGVTKGNHWHHSKNEKFLAVSGKGVIRLRKIGTESISEYTVTGEKLEVVEIPPGFTHSIENTGCGDLVVLIWANETFDPAKPDTYFQEVLLHG